jgi:putative restriction endonuclease
VIALSAITPGLRANDNGFDLELPSEGEWLVFTSSQCPLRIWLTTLAEGTFDVAFSRQNVALAVGPPDALMGPPLPFAALGGRRAVSDIPGLHRILRRAFQLSRTLPDELLQVFKKHTAELPRTTEAERLVVQRVGQDIFRGGLLDYWEGRCAVTGLAVPELLRASHIKPWADCVNDAERLDVFNGLLLAPHLDLAFDKGFISFTDESTFLISDALPLEARRLLNLANPPHPHRLLADGHRGYLLWHRTHVFRCQSPHDEPPTTA